MIIRRPYKKETKPLTKGFKEGNNLGKGRPRGSKNLAQMAILAVGEDHSKDILEQIVKQAKEGDTTSAKIILDRVCPIPKGRIVVLDGLPDPIRNMDDLDKGLDIVISEMAKGNITADEALSISTVLEKKFNIAQANLTGELLDIKARIITDA